MANALNASAPGGVVTLSSVVREGVWRVALEDQGRGVPADYMDKIFERFFRLTPAADSVSRFVGALYLCIEAKSGPKRRPARAGYAWFLRYQ